MNNKLNEYKYSGTFANRQYEELSHPKRPKMCDPILVTLLKMRPHYRQSSRENATPSSGTSLLASYKEVTTPPDLRGEPPCIKILWVPPGLKVNNRWIWQGLCDVKWDHKSQQKGMTTTMELWVLNLPFCHWSSRFWICKHRHHCHHIVFKTTSAYYSGSSSCF